MSKTNATLVPWIGMPKYVSAIVRRSFPVETYEPQASEVWAEPYERFLRLTGG